MSTYRAPQHSGNPNDLEARVDDDESQSDASSVVGELAVAPTSPTIVDNLTNATYPLG